MKQSDKYYAKLRRRHKCWFEILRFFLEKNFLKKYNIISGFSKLPEGGNLILANHVTRMDPFLIGLRYPKTHIHIVSGENVFKNKLLRWFGENCIGIIIHVRGISSQNTIKEMIKCLKRGENVLIFPSGTMTFNGRSQKQDSSIAKVAKMSGANLVLLTMDGGYLTEPRWGVTIRRGQMEFTEYIVTKEELTQMSVTGIVDTINEHLFTDAYEKQKQNPIKYIGKSLCKGLECCIYECPKCGKITGLKTTDDKIYCKCGFEAVYDEYGYLTDAENSKYTITELCDSQTKHLKEMIISAREKTSAMPEDGEVSMPKSAMAKDGEVSMPKSAMPKDGEAGMPKLVDSESEQVLFSDIFRVNKLYHDGKRTDIGNVIVQTYSDSVKYTVAGKTSRMSFDEIESVYVYMRNILNVNPVGKNYGYELQGDFSSNALKYRDLYQIVEELKR